MFSIRSHGNRSCIPAQGSGRARITLADWIYRQSEILALEPPTARGTILHLLGVSLASLEVIEEHPSVPVFHPPELSPEFVPLRARTI
jgi:hypothetical protein